MESQTTFSLINGTLEIAVKDSHIVRIEGFTMDHNYCLDCLMHTYTIKYVINVGTIRIDVANDAVFKYAKTDKIITTLTRPELRSMLVTIYESLIRITTTIKPKNVYRIQATYVQQPQKPIRECVASWMMLKVSFTLNILSGHTIIFQNDVTVQCCSLKSDNNNIEIVGSYTWNLKNENNKYTLVSNESEYEISHKNAKKFIDSLM